VINNAIWLIIDICMMIDLTESTIGQERKQDLIVSIISIVLSGIALILACSSIFTDYNGSIFTSITIDNHGEIYYLPLFPLLCSIISLIILIGFRKYKLWSFAYFLNMVAFLFCITIFLFFRGFSIVE
jgi:hypothetical protein